MLAVIAAGSVALAAPAQAGGRPVGVVHVAAWTNVYLHHDGSITASAGVKCAPGWISSDLDIRVTQGSTDAEGSTPTDVPCDNAWHPVRFVITDIAGAFTPGTAVLNSQILANNAESGDSAGGHDVNRVGCIRRPHTTHAYCPTG